MKKGKLIMDINVIGLGYIGLPTSLIFSSVGLKVHGSDINSDKIESLMKKQLPIDEKGLIELFNQSIKNKITFSTTTTKADFYIIAVPTPYISSSKKVDPSYIINATKSLLSNAKVNSIVIIESTVSPNTIQKFIIPIINDFNFKNNTNIKVAHAPERIIPGNMVNELKTNSRTIGSDDNEVLDKVAKLYSKITSGKIVKTSIYNAELTKVVENTFRAVNIAFSNELLKLGSYYKFDPYEVINICNLHPRVKILNPGPGVGGHCIPIDPWFLVGDWPLHTDLIKMSLEINESMPAFVLNQINKIKRKHNLKDNSKIGLYGLTYKEDVDDIRESPSLQLLSIIENGLGGNLSSFDPTLKHKVIEGQFLNFDEFMKNLEFVIIMVKHSHIKANLNTFINKIVLDTHNFIPSHSTKIRYLLSDNLI
jgi:UDP-N-acetyl-D-mannosaminuronic acid dehydrogenase